MLKEKKRGGEKTVRIMKRIKYILVLTMFFIIVGNSVNKISAEASASAEQKGVVISKDTFPDEYFRKKMNKYDKDKNGYLSDSEIKKITKLEVKWDATSLSGIEYLTNLREFYSGETDASINHLKKLDLTKKNKRSNYI